MTFMNFTEDTVEQKAESVGRIMPHTEVSSGPRPLDPTSYLSTGAPSLGTFTVFYQGAMQLPQGAENTPSPPAARASPGLAWGFLCGLRPEREELERWP